MDRRKFIVGTSGIALAAGLGRPAFAQDAAQPDYYPADYSALVEAAKTEGGRVLVYSSTGDVQAKFVSDGFNAKYPWANAEVLNVSAAESAERYLAESATGSTTADVIVSGAPDALMRLQERGEVVDYTSAELPGLPEWADPVPGIHVVLTEPMLFVWSKPLVSDALVPTGYADLVEKVKANPGVFNGKLATYGAHVGSFGYGMAWGLVSRHGEKAWEWLSVLGPQTNIERSAGPIIEKITLGQYSLGYHSGWGIAMQVTRDPARAAILGWKMAKDGQVFMPSGIVVMRASPSPASAKLFLDYALSHEGQIGWAKGDRVPIRPGISDEERGIGQTYESLVAMIGEENAIRVGYDPKMISDYDAFIERWKGLYNVT